MLKNITKLALILSIFIFKNLIAQDQALDTLFTSTAAPQEEAKQYFGVGVGYTASFLLVSLNDVNNLLNAQKFGTTLPKGPVYLNGIEGTIITFKVPNLRLSVYWQSGTVNSSMDTLMNGTNYNREVEYSVGYTGIALDYAIMPFKSLAIFPRISGGWGRLAIESFQGNNQNWNNIPANGDSLNYLNRIEWSGEFVSAGINIEYAPVDFIVFRFGASYNYNFNFNSSGAWLYNRNSTLSNVPTGVNNNGIAVQIGLFFGLFNY